MRRPFRKSGVWGGCVGSRHSTHTRTRAQSSFLRFAQVVCGPQILANQSERLSAVRGRVCISTSNPFSYSIAPTASIAHARAHACGWGCGQVPQGVARQWPVPRTEQAIRRLFGEYGAGGKHSNPEPPHGYSGPSVELCVSRQTATNRHRPTSVGTNSRQRRRQLVHFQFRERTPVCVRACVFTRRRRSRERARRRLCANTMLCRECAPFSAPPPVRSLFRLVSVCLYVPLSVSAALKYHVCLGL